MARTRAERRHFYAVRKKRTLRYLREQREGMYVPPGCTLTAPSPAEVGFYANTPKRCSCQMCRNQRHAWGKKTRSVQERRAQYP